MEEKVVIIESADQKSVSGQLCPSRKKRTVSFDANGNLTAKNPLACWIPEVTIKEVIGGTTFIVTGSYEGSELMTRKLERIKARKAEEAATENSSAFRKNSEEMED